jgi:hypothetical protein
LYLLKALSGGSGWGLKKTGILGGIGMGVPMAHDVLKIANITSPADFSMNCSLLLYCPPKGRY